MAGGSYTLYAGSVGRRETKSARVKVYLETTREDVREIAQACGCDPSLVRRVRRRLRIPFPAQTNQAEHGALREENRALRAEVEKLKAQVAYLLAERLRADVPSPLKTNRPYSVRTRREMCG